MFECIRMTTNDLIYNTQGVVELLAGCFLLFFGCDMRFVMCQMMPFWCRQFSGFHQRHFALRHQAGSFGRLLVSGCTGSCGGGS